MAYICCYKIVKIIMNKVILIGHVGADPEIKTFENGQITTINLATSEKGYTTKSGVVVPDKTEWHRVTFRGGLAAVIAQHVKKGQQLSVVGKIRYRSYEKDGVKVYITEIAADEFHFLGTKPQSADYSQPEQEEANEPKPLPF